MNNPEIIALIEWSSDSGQSPVVIVADTPHDARRTYLKMITGDFCGLTDVEYIDQEWIDQHPAPDLNDEDAVEAFCEAIHEATTDAWLSLFGPRPLGSSNVFGDYYIDVRAHH